jgi:hypothetical protein
MWGSSMQEQRWNALKRLDACSILSWAHVGMHGPLNCEAAVDQAVPGNTATGAMLNTLAYYKPLTYKLFSPCNPSWVTRAAAMMAACHCCMYPLAKHLRGICNRLCRFPTPSFIAC